jgi:HEAT repeat protein
MSTARQVLTFAAAMVVVPLAMRARESSAARAAANLVTKATVSSQDDPQATPDEVRAYLTGMRGANAIQCEIALSSFNSWSSSRSPDRDQDAYKVAMVIHRRIESEQLVPELVTAMKSPDDCVSRIAARLLGRSKLAPARSALMTALQDENPSVRRLAAIGIGFSDDTTASRQLVRALADRDERVRAAAAWALGAVN